MVFIGFKESNMTDIFRKEYKEISSVIKTNISCIKEKASELWNEFDSLPMEHIDQRMMDNAKTNLEQAVMWAIKAIT
jgi:hypothetical protein